MIGMETHPYGDDYLEYQISRGWFRRTVRSLYLRSAAGQLAGPTLDLGCGVGELLRRLPAGSQGLEYNPATVEYCRSHGLAVSHYDGFADDWQLSCISGDDGMQSLVVSHLLEHLDRPGDILCKLLESAARLGISSALIVVPGKRGFASDATHRTFVDIRMLANVGKTGAGGFSMQRARYFPCNWGALGRLVTHHELQVFYARA